MYAENSIQNKTNKLDKTIKKVLDRVNKVKINSYRNENKQIKKFKVLSRAISISSPASRQDLPIVALLASDS